MRNATIYSDLFLRNVTSTDDIDTNGNSDWRTQRSHAVCVSVVANAIACEARISLVLLMCPGVCHVITIQRIAMLKMNLEMMEDVGRSVDSK